MDTQKGFIGILVILLIAFIAGYYFAGHKDALDLPDILPGTASSTKTVKVYFQDTTKYAVGTEPYEVAVARKVPVAKDSRIAVLEELYKGPTVVEKQIHLALVSSQTTGATLTFDAATGVAKVYLQGKCDNNGGSYSIANLLNLNLKQFPEVKAVRIYDPAGKTLEEQNLTKDSTPSCLQP
ncbi:MAG: hypothetical protein RJB39_249 [Candidatus Parcubacteria bacterium]|jgi:hypothetical protein